MPPWFRRHCSQDEQAQRPVSLPYTYEQPVQDSFVQAQEEYEFQVALALSQSAREATQVQQWREEDAVAVAKRMSLGPSLAAPSGKAEALAFKLCDTDCLSYDDVVVDGFYDLWGDFPEVMDERRQVFPSLAALRKVQVSPDDPREVVMVDHAQDPGLCALDEKAAEAIASAVSEGPIACIQALGRVVADHMGGSVSSHNDLVERYKVLSRRLKQENKSVVVPIGRLTVGLSRHRALLFKLLADACDLPCQLLRGKFYTGGKGDRAVVMVKCEGKETMVDLIIEPGRLLPVRPESLPRLTLSLLDRASGALSPGPSSSSLARPSPLGLDWNVEGDLEGPALLSIEDVSTSSMEQDGAGPDRGRLRTGRLGDAISLEGSPRTGSLGIDQQQRFNALPMHAIVPLAAEDASWQSATTPVGFARQSPAGSLDAPKHGPILTSGMRMASPPSPRTSPFSSAGTCPHCHRPMPLCTCDASPRAEPSDQPFRPPTFQASKAPSTGQEGDRFGIRPLSPLRNAPPQTPFGHGWYLGDEPKKSAKVKPAQALAAVSAIPSGSGSSLQAHPVDLTASLEEPDEWEIPAEEIELGPRIGIGSYGEVYRSTWRHTDVAVKRLLEQDLSPSLIAEFKAEVAIMKRLKHPNVVLFMGACTQPPNLCIVTQFVPRGSLFKILHRSPTVPLDDRRRMRIALDVARGMNYLHSCKPPIVHRDLKSPNLLVDKDFTVKVCDFGLSRVRRSTWLSSKSQAGTPEWTAPEVLRSQSYNEKSDVYSFGVILWELVSGQEPWQDKSPMQVVGAVGWGNARLPIPEDISPQMQSLIASCWAEPEDRPSFEQIISILKPILAELPTAHPPPMQSADLDHQPHAPVQPLPLTT
ncbi:hypothetical protein WJX72_005059 [[Myrmecia] bisecta]|uniref:non-specific serine/threonine protein kinase n=1 Tax=[Myrmecia] bisecta TaxID=41462 RepID=A0AAW1Q1S1_9CHLO